MYRLQGFVLSLTLLSSAAWAHPPQWYLGGSGGLGWIGENQVISRMAVDANRRTALDGLVTGHSGDLKWYSGLGAQVEGGISGDYWMALLGFRQAAGWIRESSPYDNDRNATENWQTDRRYSSRILLGGRLHVSDHTPNRLKSLLGAGISYGWLIRTYQYHFSHSVNGRIVSSYEEHATQRSAGGWGIWGEVGLLYRLNSQTTFTLIFHYDEISLPLERGADFGLDPVYNTREAGLRLGIVREFRLTAK
jgi:hypothetical protein